MRTGRDRNGLSGLRNDLLKDRMQYTPDRLYGDYGWWKALHFAVQYRYQKCRGREGPAFEAWLSEHIKRDACVAEGKVRPVSN